ncbi:MAG: tandem-95 repeat protein [Pirellulales bacterium]|nr:tandem-95 repeat protein [Pirellulales bacterium]
MAFLQRASSGLREKSRRRSGKRTSSNSRSLPRFGRRCGVEQLELRTLLSIGGMGLDAQAVHPSSVEDFIAAITTTGSDSPVYQAGEQVPGLGEIHGAKYDDLDGDGAVREPGEPGLAGWTIYLDGNGNGTLDSGTVTTVSQTTSLPIPDLSTVTSTLDVSGIGASIDDLNVTLNIEHTWVSDLDVYLIAPSGTRVELFTDVDDGGNNFTNTTLDDEAAISIVNGIPPYTGTFRPEGLLSDFDGEMTDGTWTLEITDDAMADIGTLLNWSLEFTTSEISTVTGADGSYSFTGLPADTYTVREVPQTGWMQTYPGVGSTSLLGITWDGTLYDVDPATGAAGNPRNTGITYPVGITIAADGTVYALDTYGSSPQPNSLYTIDPITGSSSLVGTTGLNSISEGDLDFDPTTGELYGIQDYTGWDLRLFKLNTSTGVATVVGNLEFGDMSAMAFDAAGTLFMLDTDVDRLLTINKTTGATLTAVPLSVNLGVIAGMDFDPATGTLYVVDGAIYGGTNSLYQLNPTTGQLTLIGSTGLSGDGLSGLNFLDSGADGAHLVTLAAGEVAPDKDFGNFNLNDPPEGTDSTVTMLELDEGTPYTFAEADFGFTDPLDTPPDAFNQVKITTLPSAGTLFVDEDLNGSVDPGEAVTADQFVTAAQITAGKLKFTLPVDANGSPYTNFTFQVEDDGGTLGGGVNLDQTPNTMTVNVTPVNDEPVRTAPVASPTPLPTIYDDEDSHNFTSASLNLTGLNYAPGPATATDELASQTLTYQVTHIPSYVQIYKANGVTRVHEGNTLTLVELQGLRYKTVANENGNDPRGLEWTITDNGPGAPPPNDNQLVDHKLIVIHEINDAPVAFDDYPVTTEDTPMVITSDDLTDNDSKGPTNENDQILTVIGLPFPYQTTTSAMGGTVELIDGNIIYTPPPNFHGEDTFRYTVRDDGTSRGVADPKSALGFVFVTVIEVNDAPTANPDVVGPTVEDTPLVIHIGGPDDDLLSNDIPGPPDESWQIFTDFEVRATGDTHGTLVPLSGSIPGTVIYTPSPHFNGLASFEYRVKDNGITDAVYDPQWSNWTTVSLTVTAINDGPAWTLPVSVTGNEDTDIPILNVRADDVDVDEGTGYVEVEVWADHGVLTLGQTAGLTFSIGDGTSDRMMRFTGLLYADDVNDALATLVYRGDQDYNGSDVIHLQVNDLGNTGAGGPLWAEGAIPVMVNAVNDAPEFDDLTFPGAQTVDEDTDLAISGINVKDVDVYEGTGEVEMTLSAEHGVMTLTTTDGLTFTVGDGYEDPEMVFTGLLNDVNAAVSVLWFRGDEHYNGSDLDEIDVTVNDLGNYPLPALSDSGSIAITVVAINDAPTLNLPGPEVTLEDTDLIIKPSSSGVFSNPASIAIPYFGYVNPYPSNIIVSGMSGTVTDVNVSLNDITHSFPDDIDILLVGPQGQTMILMSDCGDGWSGGIANVFLTLDDQAPGFLPNGPQIFSGTYKPTNYPVGSQDFFPAPAPDGPYGANLAVFNGAAANGLWSLYVYDDNNGMNIGQIAGGWSLEITTTDGQFLVSDVDVGEGDVQMTLQADHGVITLGTTNGLAFETGDGTADETMTFTGSLADVNAAVASLTYRGNLNYNGPDTILVYVNDQGNTGASGPLSVNGTIQIMVNPMNDPPVLTLPGPQTTPEDTSLAISGIHVEDLDVNETPSPDNTVQATLSVSHGKLALADGTTSSGRSVTVTGTLAEVNTALSLVVYTPDLNFNGLDDLIVTANDLGHTGLPGPQSASGSVPITVTAVNDAPELTLPGTRSGNEDADIPIGSSAADTFSNPDLISIPYYGAANPYPSNIVVSGMTGVVTDVNVSLYGVSHTWPDDIDIMLVGPAGQRIMLVSDCGDGFSGGIYNVNLTLDDQAAGYLPDSSLITSGVYKPTNYPVGSEDYFPAPAPGVPYGSQLAEFNGTDPNGTWSLYVVDDDAFFAQGSIAGGWSLTIATQAPYIHDVDVAEGTGEVNATLYAGHGVMTLGSTTGLTFWVGDGAGDKMMNFRGQLDDVNAALEGMVYRGDLNFNGQDSILVQVDDLGNTGEGGTRLVMDWIGVTVNPVNDGPVLSVPGSQTANEDVDKPISGIHVTDVDAYEGTGTVRMTLSANHGVITLTTTDGLTFEPGAGDGYQDQTMTFSGLLNYVNAAVGTIVYRGNPHFNGPDTIHVVANDLGNWGQDPGLTNGPTSEEDQADIAVTVNAVNDAPVLTLPGAQSGNEDEPIPLSGIHVTDVDVDEAPGTGEVLMILQADHGVLTLAQTDGLTFLTGDGTEDETMKFTGLLADVNNAVATLTYRGNQDYNGSDTILVFVDDQGNTGAGGPLSDNGTIDVTVNAVNDTPTVDGPASYSTLEDTDLPIPGIFVDDPDVNETPAPNNTVMVWLSADHGIILPGAGPFTGTLSEVNTWLAARMYRPNQNYNGSDTIHVTVNDLGHTGIDPGLTDGPTSEEAQLSIPVTVTSVNDAPEGTDNTVTTNEDTTYTFTAAVFGFTDPHDNPSDNFAGVWVDPCVNSPSHLSYDGVGIVSTTVYIPKADLDSGKLKFIPAQDENGDNIDHFTFRVKDDGGTTNGGHDTDPTSNTMWINVRSVNDPPEGIDNAKTVLENTPLESHTYAFQPSDFPFVDPHDNPPNDLAGVWVTPCQHSPSDPHLYYNGVPISSITYVSTPDLTAGKLTYTAPLHENLLDPWYFSDSFSFAVKDDGGTAYGGQDTDPIYRTMSIVVTPVNDKPVPGVDNKTTDSNTMISFDTWWGLLTNDSPGPGDEAIAHPNPDPDYDLSAQELTVISVGWGDITSNVDGVWYSNPHHAGRVRKDGNTVTYDPQGYVGTESFSYLVRDDGESGWPPLPDYQQATGMVIITVTGTGPATRTWDGGGGDNLWTTPANWLGDVAPAAGDNLVFPFDALKKENFNNYPAGTVFGSITIGCNGYDVQGGIQADTVEVQEGSLLVTPSITAGTLTIGGSDEVGADPPTSPRDGQDLPETGPENGAGNKKPIAGDVAAAPADAARKTNGNVFKPAIVSGPIVVSTGNHQVRDGGNRSAAVKVQESAAPVAPSVTPAKVTVGGSGKISGGTAFSGVKGTAASAAPSPAAGVTEVSGLETRKWPTTQKTVMPALPIATVGPVNTLSVEAAPLGSPATGVPQEISLNVAVCAAGVLVAAPTTESPLSADVSSKPHPLALPAAVCDEILSRTEQRDSAMITDRLSPTNWFLDLVQVQNQKKKKSRDSMLEQTFDSFFSGLAQW